nr:zinc finger ccch domain-containing protein [Quercus suber]
MDEQAKLQYKIAQLAAQVDQAKRDKARQQSGHRESFVRHHGNRWTPYGQPHRNLSLVASGASPSLTTSKAAQESLAPSVSDLNMVKPTGKSHQLVNESILRREQANQEELKRKIRASREQRTNQDTTVSRNQGSQVQAARLMELDGLHFRMSEDGSKLTREHDDGDKGETPKKATIAGVTFLRTKHGNLLRAASDPKSARFSHDPEKVAVCKEFLRTGNCAQGSNCDLSHRLSYHRVPACTHFLRGNCTNNACRYPHVSVSPSAQVCRAFAILGYCSQGPRCDKRHVVECPAFANTGNCADHAHGKCKLPHVERANTLRKAARRQAKQGFEDESDLSSDEEPGDQNQSRAAEDSDALESDIEGLFDDLLTGSDGGGTESQTQSHAFAAQQDYVRIS